MRTVFASDTHLAPERPQRIAEFSALLARVAAWHATLYLLGDVVEFWPGDDDDAPLHRELVVALRRLTDAGCRVHVARGNRDFLIGDDFRRETGAGLLEDWTTLALGGDCALLTHGDLLCTRDLKYQEFRRFVRDPARQRQFLGLPLTERRRIALQTREGTQSSMAEKAAGIMDVDDAEVARVMRDHGATLLVHGHTHRPALHDFILDGRSVRRCVLGDWYDAGRVLVHDEAGLRLLDVPAVLALD
ncbi:MAG: UDP-2,3-diacylglucosamine diphosphatase [Gammaproteobacteria bacterium]|nr:UDP-2,3-diacylglucosamine diphosphatase [Gammaproteobacteria bacterium]